MVYFCQGGESYVIGEIHRADIYTLLKDMCKKGFLHAEGHGRGTKYYLLPKDNLERNLERKLKKRMGKGELCKAIVSACQDWVSLGEIATATERNPYYLLNEVIPAMLEEELIERMYPDAPRHPYQKYKKKS